jgi:3-methyladenine DNA glycosylase/8-oxoguanine DNA glycosylase
MPETHPLPLRLRLRLPTPYDVAWVFGFLADRATTALERVTATEHLRVVRTPAGRFPSTSRVVVLVTRPGPDPAAPRWLDVEATTIPESDDPAPTIPSAAAVRRLVRRMFDLDTDLAAFLALARRDPLLAPLVRQRPGLRLPQVPDPFECAVRAIVGQQVSVAGARTVVDRIIRDLGTPLPPIAPAGLFAFPTAAAMAAAPVERLTALGLTRAKAAALRGVAAASRDGVLDWAALRRLPQEDAQALLVALPGIGPWTASYIRMRSLGDRDAFPAADLGILKALPTGAAPSATPAGTTRPTPAAALALAEAWRPYRAYAAIHLWRSLAP